MARFRFRLETLLRVRTALKKEAQRNLSRKVEALNLAKEALQSMLNEHGQVVQSRAVAPGQTLDLAQWRYIERYLVVLERRISQGTAAVEAAGAQMAEAREALRKAHVGQLILERLKERKLAQFEQEEALRQAKELDDLAILRHRFHTQN